MQETALELLRHRSYVRSPGGFVFAVFRSRCTRFVGACQSRRKLFAGPPTDDTPGAETPEGIDRQLALREALDEVSSACRRLLCSYYVEGKSLREAASVMSLAYSSVAKTISRCLEKLRKRLA
jgi:RNA polymerase sigma factor (sigma-70 family)